jgi:hypothetical protein
MSIKDSYTAKLRLWAAEARVVGFPKATGFPQFGCRRFSSGDEMNRWKKELLAETTRQGGVKWTK